MKRLLQNAITYIFALIARILTPTFQKQIQRLCVHLVADIPQLGNAWVVRFKDPLGSRGSCTKIIDANLQQFGRYLWGNGHFQGEPGDPFIYRGIIKRNAFYGTFRRKDSHILAGTGTFVLKISADSKTMVGRCSWYDSFIDDVWSSKYIWECHK